MTEFVGFSKIARLNRDIVVTEKIDGTNAQIVVNDTGDDLQVGSRNRWLTEGSDNYGFHKWCMDNKPELLKLGPGQHFGEWWGAGIQRRYGLTEKRFSLFNAERWGAERPACCHVVPVLFRGNFKDFNCEKVLADLRNGGSVAAPRFMDPEGLIIYHTADRRMFKVTCHNDEKGKGE